jgi:tripartite-type tricarboxylate transporter receptor subunit TctC
MKRSLSYCAILFAAWGIATPFAHAQTYPNKIVRILTTEAGSGTDLVARLIAQGFSATLGQQAVVENRGILAVEAAAKAPPDGHTLLVYSSSMWILPFLRENPTWDAEKDFSPVTQLYRQPNVIVINPSLPVASARELIALARAKPGELNYGSASSGSPAHLSAELFNTMAGVKIVRVPYKGIGPAITALIGGQIQLIFAIYTSASPHLISGRLKALAVTSAEPTALAPGVPTLAASGLPGYESIALAGLFSPAKTPAAVIAMINQEAAKVLSAPKNQERLASSGVESATSTPAEFAATIKADMAKWGKLIRDSGIRE